MSRFRTDSAIGVELHHPVAFWVGVVLLISGVLAHLPEFFSMDYMGYSMAGMEMSTEMLAGMGAILVGLSLATWGLIPRLSTLTQQAEGAMLHVHAMDNARLSWVHFWLLFVLCIALVVDVMKPATLGFVMPGMKAEYGLTTRELSIFPLCALTGTTLGSFLWGIMSDRIGRRATIMLAALFFVATSICGFMPSFNWNLFMCFIMGLSAGGMLPIVYALMAEIVPVRMRGWLIILHGGIGTTCGYLVASGLAALFEPVYTWRILWFFGLPTGLAIVALNRYIPESPRFLLSRGDEAAARAVMSRFGIVVEQRPASVPEAVKAMMARAGQRMSALQRFLAIFKPPLTWQSLTILLYGVGWGLVNWGFLTFLPTLLRDAGFAASGTSVLLFEASFAALPAIALVAFLYGTWSSRKTMAGCAALTCLVMAVFALLSPDIAHLDRLQILLVVMTLMAASTAVISMLSPYAAEVYPTRMRGTGSGFAAGTGKFGGMIGPPLMGVMLSAAATPVVPILVMGIPIGLAALVLAFTGVETRGKGLEQISDKMGQSPHERQDG